MWQKCIYPISLVVAYPPIERLPPNTTPSSCFVHADSSFEVLLNNLNFFLYAQLLFV